MLVDVVGTIARVRSPLGDIRETAIRGTDECPWYACPFCSYAVYVREPAPDHAALSYVSKNGRCLHPWCICHPDMPLDRAREARGAEMLALMEEETRSRNHASAMRRIEDEREERERVYAERLAEVRAAGQCVECFRATRKRVKHRVFCPRT